MKALRFCILIFTAFFVLPGCALAQVAVNDVCPRPAAGSAIAEPEDLRSHDGVLKVELRFRSYADGAGAMRFCYVSADGSEAPTLRVNPGDLLLITLKNEISAAKTAAPRAPMVTRGPAAESNKGCAAMAMSIESTNLHFHGLSVPPVCHQDDVLNTSILPGDPAFEYRVQIPFDQAPGLYWYHPHIHGFSKAQVLGGASGALVIEGIERVNHEVGGLPERILIVRDQDLVNPNAEPSKTEPASVVIRDREGDVVNTGTGTGKPAKDLSLNFVPVPFPDYPAAVIRMKPAERQLWRVLNASAITYLNLQVLYDGVPQILGIVGVDGAPLNERGMTESRALWLNHVGLAPGGRIEFIVKGPADGKTGSLITQSVNTGPGGENDPVRPLATIIAAADAVEPRSALSARPAPIPHAQVAWLGDVTPVRTRKLYLSEKLQDPNDPNSPTTFYVTVDGQRPTPYDPNSMTPNIVVHQGDVEDWIIENRSQELHDFHIHQIHYLMLEWNGREVNEPFLRDTVNVPFWDGKSSTFPSVKLRMDFRSPNIMGTFPYHCHLLEHEDGGMMGLVRVEAANESKAIVAPEAPPKNSEVNARGGAGAPF